ncbi:MAG TPA: hypothetical protein VMT64_02835 [Candidatus Binataceae bacterium]|nr:hypothetical protein [Candidatus Binataceae bacterium]
MVKIQLVRLPNRTLLVLGLLCAFAIRAPMPCAAAQMPSHCPMHSATPPCCRISGCFARHDVVSVEAAAALPTPILTTSFISRNIFDGFIRAVALSPSLSPQTYRSIEFRPLLI